MPRQKIRARVGGLTHRLFPLDPISAPGEIGLDPNITRRSAESILGVGS